MALCRVNSWRHLDWAVELEATSKGSGDTSPMVSNMIKCFIYIRIYIYIFIYIHLFILFILDHYCWWYYQTRCDRPKGFSAFQWYHPGHSWLAPGSKVYDLCHGNNQLDHAGSRRTLDRFSEFMRIVWESWDSLDIFLGWNSPPSEFCHLSLPLLELVVIIRRVPSLPIMVAMLDAVVATLSEQRQRVNESQLSSNATSILFKLSCKLTPEEAVGRLDHGGDTSQPERTGTYLHFCWGVGPKGFLVTTTATHMLFCSLNTLELQFDGCLICPYIVIWQWLLITAGHARFCRSCEGNQCRQSSLIQVSP